MGGWEKQPGWGRFLEAAPRLLSPVPERRWTPFIGPRQELQFAEHTRNSFFFFHSEFLAFYFAHC